MNWFFQPSPGLYVLKVGHMELTTEVVVDPVNRTDEWWEDVNYYQRECPIPATDLTATIWYVPERMSYTSCRPDSHHLVCTSEPFKPQLLQQPALIDSQY